MKPFLFTQRRRHGIRPWLRTLAGTCLAVTIAGGLAMIAGGTAGAPALTFKLSVSSFRRGSDGVAAPTGLTAQAGDSQVTLWWNTVPSQTSYFIYEATTPDINDSTKVDTLTDTTGAVATATVSQLTNGTTYYFWVAADYGDPDDPDVGPPSTDASATPVSVATRPGPPTALTATPGNAQVSLSWTAPASDGGSLVTGYHVYQGTTQDFADSTIAGSPTGTSTTVTRLTDGTTYYFWVAADYGDPDDPDVGPPSTDASATPVSVATRPGPPTALTATPGNAQVSLSWTAPASDGGSLVTGYHVYQGTTQDFADSTIAGSPTGTSTTVTRLTNGTTYYFWVAADYGDPDDPDVGPPSTDASATPVSVATRPGRPTALTATPGNAQVSLSWTAPASDGGSLVTGYHVYQGTTQDFADSTIAGSPTGTSTTVTRLTDGTTYYFWVAAVNANGKQGTFSGEASAKPIGPAKGSPAAPTPKQLIVLLAAVAAAATAGVFTLAARGRRLRSRPLRARQQVAPVSDVRAVPDTGRPGVVSVRDIGQGETHTVRLEPNPGAASTTIKEGRP